MRTTLTWEYVSAFFDGEGCVLVHPRRDGRNTFTPHVSVCQAEPQEKIIYMIQEFWQGEGAKTSLSVQQPTGQRAKQPLHRLTVCAQPSVKLVLEQMIPFLVVKHDKATKVLERVNERLELRSHLDWRSVLNDVPEKQVRQMFKLWKGGMSQTAIGTKYGMNQVAVSRLFRIRSATLTIPV